MATRSTASNFRNRQGKHAFVCAKEIQIIEILEIYLWSFFLTNHFSLLESYQLHIIAKYKARNCYKIEAAFQRYSLKKIILENSQENPCARVSFLIKLQLKKRLRQSYFPVNIWKFLRTPFFIPHFRWRPEVKLEPSLCSKQNFSSSYFWQPLIS